MGDSSQLIVRFERLMHDVENGNTKRNTFRPWEVELLLDMMSCELGSARNRVLRRYRKAVHRCLERGAAKPLMLSEYLSRSHKRASAA
jgi:hypothetical protein